MNFTDDNSIIDEKTFGLRLAQLRQIKNVSAREMSLAIGQNKNYINSIELGKSFPSMASFLYICDYMNITPKDFFDSKCQNPLSVDKFINTYKQLAPEQAEHVYKLMLGLINKD